MAGGPEKAAEAGEAWSPELEVPRPGPFPVSIRHPEPPRFWRKRFDPPLPCVWYCLDLVAGPVGVLDGRLAQLFADGTRLYQSLAKVGRNRFRCLFRPAVPLAGLEVELCGSSPPESWPEPRLRTPSAWEQRRAFLRRGVDVLKGDPRSVLWRAARFAVQLQRQGRTTIPIVTAARTPAEAFAIWRERFDERDEDLALHRSRAEGLTRSPLFTVVADPDIDADQLGALLVSLKGQAYEGWELFAPRLKPDNDPRVRPMPQDGGTAAQRIDGAIAQAGGDYLLLPRPGTQLRAHALLVFALACGRFPQAKLLYADDDDVLSLSGSRDSGIALHPEERGNPRFKPAWSPARALSWNYVGDPCCFNMPLIRALGAAADLRRTAQAHDLLLRATAGLSAADVVHVAQILSHAMPASGAEPAPEEAAVVRGRLAAAGRAARVVADPRSPYPRVVHEIAEPPLVSIIIPTRDRARLLRMSVGSIRRETRYPRFEIIVVDNGSREEETLRLFKSWAGDPVMRVVADAGPFNYSALNNLAAAAASGSILALVNNDIEVTDPGWLDEMVGWALQPGIGCVGAKLFYPDGRLQHGGVVTGIGGAAGHRSKRASRAQTGMLDSLVTVNEVSAVTAACLVVKKSVYEEVGGLDAELFAVGYNDVDFCLKVAAAGHRNLWTPFAELIHHESVSRGRDLSPKTSERFNREVLTLRRRWGERLLDDPYYSPNLTLDAEDGAVRTQ